MEDVYRSIGIMHKRDSSLSFLCCLLSRSSGWCEPHIVLKFVVKDSNKVPGFTLTMKKWKCELLSHVWLFCHLMDCQPTRLPCLWNSPDKNTEVGSHSLVWGFSQPRDQARVSCIAGRFLPSEPRGKPHLDHAYLQYNFKMLSNNIVRRWETRKLMRKAGWWLGFASSGFAILEFYLFFPCSPLYNTFQEYTPNKSICLPGRANFDLRMLALIVNSKFLLVARYFTRCC